MPNLVKECKKYGTYCNKLFNLKYPKIEVVTVQDILDGKKLALPAGQKIVKSAKAKKAVQVTADF